MLKGTASCKEMLIRIYGESSLWFEFQVNFMPFLDDKDSPQNLDTKTMPDSVEMGRSSQRGRIFCLQICIFIVLIREI